MMFLIQRVVGVFLVCLFVACGLSAQSGEFFFRDHTYVDYIRTVKFHIRGLETSMPVVELGSRDALQLSFDDMEAVPKYYKYTVIHCDRNWVQSELWRDEYVDGFSDEDIDYLDYSVNTMQQYIRYSLVFPNRDFNITKSGNYILVVFDSSNPEQPVITRRFVVVEPVVRINARRLRPADVSKMNTHQEIRFDLDIKDLFPKPRNPKVDITATVVQNGRWDNAIQGLVSRREQMDTYFFDGVNVITFPAGKEFRGLDIRSIQFRSTDIFELERLETHIVEVRKIDEPRSLQPFFSRIDINGNFVISTIDFGPDVNHKIRADYVEVVFTLQPAYKYTEDVYIFGRVSDWELKDEFKMHWDDKYQAYSTSVWLKQGFYDFIYVLANPDGSADEATIEGNWYESTNDYTILVYYRPFGGRYDQLIGAKGL